MLSPTIVVQQKTPQDDTSREESSTPSEEGITYKGRKIARSVRLQQMRESQKLLREQRKLKIKNLEDENARLRTQIDILKKASGNYIPKSANPDTFFPPKLLEITYNHEYVPLNGDRFLQGLPDEIIQKFYLDDGKCIVTAILERNFDCIAMDEPVERSLRLRNGVFRYSPSDEITRTFFTQLRHYTIYKSVPVQWLEINNFLPGGTISVFTIVEYIYKYADLHSLSMELLGLFITKHLFATYWGPALYVTDLSACISAALDPLYDEEYLSGGVPQRICE